MNSKALLGSILLFGIVTSNQLMAQAPAVEFPSPSPVCDLKQRIGLTDLEIIYSRPGMKGRTIFGGLAPYGEVWRTGANSSTKISFSTDVRLNGTDVPAGKYALFTIPGEKQWTVIIYKDAAINGAFGYNPTNDLVRFSVTPAKLSEPVETFSIEVNDLRDDSATINLVWEKTRVSIKLETDLVRALVPKIEAAMAKPDGRKPYYQAAMFYFDHGLDLEKAKQWIVAAAAERETYYIVHLKAKILAKTGDKAGAIEAARRSSELAVKAEGPKSGYAKMNEDLISSLR